MNNLNRRGKINLTIIGAFVIVMIAIMAFATGGSSSGNSSTEVSGAVQTVQQEEIATAESTVPVAVPSNNETPASASAGSSQQDAEEIESEYVLNTSTMTAHIPSCRDAERLKSGNRLDVTSTPEKLSAQGYKPCGHCHPW